MFCKTVHVHTLYCNYNKSLNRVKTVEERGKPRSVLGWFLNWRTALYITKDRDSEIMNRDRGRGSYAVFDREAVSYVRRRYCIWNLESYKSLGTKGQLFRLSSHSLDFRCFLTFCLCWYCLSQLLKIFPEQFKLLFYSEYS